MEGLEINSHEKLFHLEKGEKKMFPLTAYACSLCNCGGETSSVVDTS